MRIDGRKSERNGGKARKKNTQAERLRERKRNRKRDRDIEIQRKTEKGKERKKERKRKRTYLLRNSEMQRDMAETVREKQWEADTHRGRRTDIHTDIHACVQTDRQTVNGVS